MLLKPRAFHASSLALLVLVTACGQDKQTKETTKSGGTGDAPPITKEGEPLDLATLEYGPYLAAALIGAADKQAGVEFGIIDMTRQKGSSTGKDLFSYRWRMISAVGANKFLPASPGSGCAEVKAKFSAGESFATEISASGAASGTLKKGADGVFRMEDEENKKVIDELKPLTVTFKDGPTITPPKLPEARAIQLSGAFNANLNNSVAIKDINSNLKKFAGDDLTLADTGTGDDYNAIVVTFYGSAASKTKVTRCYIPAQGSASLTPAQHQALAPIRGFVYLYANVETKTNGGTTTWASGIGGIGVEDLTVP